MVAYIAGRHAPPDRRMGHSGAIIAAGLGGPERKIEALREAAVQLCNSPVEIGQTVRNTIDKEFFLNQPIYCDTPKGGL